MKKWQARWTLERVFRTVGGAHATDPDLPLLFPSPYLIQYTGRNAAPDLLETGLASTDVHCGKPSARITQTVALIPVAAALDEDLVNPAAQ